ncbi:Probable RNA-directed DNA polymerase from transposon BS [Eumeta japonica]|uniref:Probable RNA-directed DNA polymerase from transposon BS n=1 Tax=Eumeta variegata TaxID=151549 RepID=A0A4C1T2G4_EUMVA|nr:Probable RNA-directed DNA polymerase from transposon BS [Eumeta japonica]
MRIHPFMIKFLLHHKITVEEPHNVQGQFSATTVRDMGKQNHIASCQQFALSVGNYMGCPCIFCCKAVYETETKIRVRSGTKRVACPVAYPQWPKQPQNRFTISADQYEEFYKSLGTRFLAAGDYNAKHTYWGSRLITPRGRTLFNTITKMGLDVISSGEPTYWPSDRQKIPDVIDFGVTKNISRELVDVEASLDLSSDHSPTIVSIRIPQRYEQPFTNMNVISHTNWLRFKSILVAIARKASD